MTRLMHLAENVKPLVELSVEQRVQLMLVDRFITHDRLKPIADFIDHLRWAPQKSRAAGLVVHGQPGTGKTMLARAVLRRYPSVPATVTAATTRPVVMISMTGAKEAKHLINRLLTALDAPIDPGCTAADRERLALRLCRAAKVQMIIVDEVQDILNSTPRQQGIALDTVKYLMNELMVPLLVLGTDRAMEAMKVDKHLNARFRYRSLPLWKADDYLARFLEALELRLPLKKRSALSAPSMMKQLVEISEGVLDVIVRTVCHAAVYAVRSGDERVTKETLELAATTPPLLVDPQTLQEAA